MRKKTARKQPSIPKEKTLKVIRSSIANRKKEWQGKERGDGFVIIQIDGLPHPILMQALSEGYMPFVQGLLASGDFNVSRYRCGIPGNTPASQSGIMYGENFGIPAFRWLDKQNDSLVSFKNPLSAQTVEQSISQGKRGILENGSSYINLLSGGAKRSVLTLSTFLTQDMQKRISGLAIFFLFFFNIIPVFRSLLSSVLELFRELYEYLEIRLKGGVQKSEGFFPMVRIFSNVLFFEVATVGALIDINQGRPSIWLTYNGYDEAAHQRGPETKYALKTLRVIDRGIRKIVRQIRKKRRGMHYDVYILSDHGQHPSIPFRYEFGETLENFIYSKVKEGRIAQYDSGGDVKDYLMLALSSTLYNFADQNLFFMRRIFKRIAKYIERNILPEETRKITGNISIVNSSPMSNLYFNIDRGRVDLEQIERVYPGLVGALVRHKGIGLILARSDGDPMILSRAGRVFYHHGKKRIDGDDPLSGFEDAELIEAEILQQFSMPNAGDLVLYGAFKEGRIINFEEQMGGHGGIGGMQNTPFILYPSRIKYAFHSIRNSRELYPVFSKYLGKPSPLTPSPPDQGHALMEGADQE
ncbi:MAG: alkaline phosphatase family protein [Deltaproteobacteria bacterium]|nr:alkaline phosphatase family protein [Deltaproteobacteria bacterium]